MVKILICDDDQTFAQSMFKRILSLPAYSSKSMKLSCLTDIAEMSADTIAQYDILFLDIDLGKESGIDLARKMRKMNPEAVLIFVTNFSEYAPEGYEVDAFRYLAKSELEKKLPTYFEDALAMCRTRQRKVEILCEGESVPIPVQSLAWIESQGREQYLHLVGGCREQLITRLTMTQLEDLLVPHGFLRMAKVEDCPGFETFGADVKAEPFKLWLAQVGRERIEETIDPEQAIDRALETYQKRDMIQTGFISGFFLSVSVMSLPLNGRSEAYSRAKNI